MKTIVAIDPGASGGIAWKNSVACGVVKMPATDHDIVALLRDLSVYPGGAVVFMENIVKHMGVGIPASTMAVYASNWGVVKGCVITLGMRLELVTPQQWQKSLGLGITGRQRAHVTFGMNADQAKAERKRVQTLNSQLKRDWKNKLKDTAQRLYPTLNVTLAGSDALLILEYGRKTIGQMQ